MNYKNILPALVILASICRGCSASQQSNFHAGVNQYSYDNALKRHQVYNEDGMETPSTESSVRYSYTPIAKAKCPSNCVDRTEFIQATKEQIRKEILRKLNLNAPPNVTSNDAPKHLIEQLKRKYDLDENEMGQSDQPELMEEDDFHFQTREISILAQNGAEVPDTKVQFVAKNMEIQYFDLKDKKFNWKDVKEAYLRVHLPAAHSDDDLEAFISLAEAGIDKNGNAYYKDLPRRETKLKSTSGGWVKIDVREMVVHWLKNPETNLGLSISAKSQVYQRNIPVGILHMTSNDQTPYITLDISDNAWRKRQRRSSGNICRNNTEDGNEQESSCCLWPFTIDFEKEFDWKFVIYPPKYEASMCSGDCSIGKMSPENNYHHVMQQANNLSPCCTPKKMKSINMLYMDDQKNVLMGKLPNMKVEKCGCA